MILLLSLAGFGALMADVEVEYNSYPTRQCTPASAEVGAQACPTVCPVTAPSASPCAHEVGIEVRTRACTPACTDSAQTGCPHQVATPAISVQRCCPQQTAVDAPCCPQQSTVSTTSAQPCCPQQAVVATPGRPVPVAISYTIAATASRENPFVKLLSETESEDTFLLTAMTLAQMKLNPVEARDASLAVIKGAERLGLSKGLFQSNLDNPEPTHAMLMQVVQSLATKMTHPPVPVHNVPPPTPMAPVAPTAGHGPYSTPAVYPNPPAAPAMPATYYAPAPCHGPNCPTPTRVHGGVQ